MKFYGASDVGLKRIENQDSYALVENTNECILAVICDGIGGGNAGDVASQIACDHLKNEFMKGKPFTSDIQAKHWLQKVICEANDLIFMQSAKSFSQKGMGTTCVGVLITPKGSYIFNVGDSRLYGLYQEFVCLTVDHSLVSDLVKKGEITPEEAEHHPNRNMLTNALGIWDRVKIDINKIKSDYTKILICSDGLHGYVEEKDILMILMSQQDTRTKVYELIEKANEIGGFDNVSAILLEKEEGDLHG